MNKIYLDNNATTGVDPQVAQAMLQELSMVPANPSSVHYFGQEARSRLSKARHLIADYLQVKPNEIIFTSGGTESLNLILRGLALEDGHILTTDVEHAAIFNTLKEFPNVTYLPVGKWGAATPAQVEAALLPSTRLIVLTAVNNETGVKTDIEAIAQIAKQAHIPFVVDGVALLGKEPFSLSAGISAMAFSGHKIHGPKGIGFAFIRSSLKLKSLFTGGDQEYGKRPGTENLPGIIGLATAIQLLKEDLPQASKHMLHLRDHFENRLRQTIGEILINGEGPRTVNTSNVTFPGQDGESLLMALDLAGIAVSHGSACASGSLEPSRVLLNMGLSRQQARSSLRFSLSRWTTLDEIEHTVHTLKKYFIQI